MRAVIGRCAFVGVLTLAGACTEPEFVVDLDAGTSSGRDRDASPGKNTHDADSDDAPPDVTVDPIARQGFPTWGPSLSNTSYVMRARFFVHGASNAQEQHELIGRVKVSSENKSAVFSIVEVCERTIVRLDGSTSPPTVVSTSTVAAPWRIEARSFTLSLPESPANTFTTVGPKSSNVSWSEPCTRGAKACTCPRDLSALPATVDDCRVSDLDGDRTPGLQLNVREGAADVIDQVVMRETLNFVDGKATGSALTSARLDFSGDISTLVCGGKDRTCMKEGWTGCLSANNPVEFVRNPPSEAETTALTCDQIRAQLKEGTLFKLDALPFPATSC